MDVRDLAPALLSVGRLFDAANLALNEQETQIRVNVRATKQGSFEIDLELVLSLAQQVSSFLKTDTVTNALKILELVAAGGAGLWSLVKLVQKLRGGKPDKIENLENGMVRITVAEETFDVPVELLRLYQDLNVRTALKETIAPLSRDGVENLHIRNSFSPPVVIGKKDIPCFEIPEITDELLSDRVSQAAFSIIALSFKEDNKWRLYDGNNTISALIADEDFLNRVNENQVSFRKGDLLLCDVHIVQMNTKDGLKTDYEVIKVREHRPADIQLPLL